MNATMHWPESLKVVPSERYADLYLLCVTYEKCSDEQFIRAVHVPEQLKAALEGAPEGFHLETLALGSEASRLLPGSPQYAVLAVVDRDGVRRCQIPAAWRAARRQALLVALISTVAACALSASAHGSLAAIGACLAACFAFTSWRRAADLRFNPMQVFVEVGT